MVSADLASVLTDDRAFCSTFIIIDDRYGNERTFEFNAAQEILYGNLTDRTLVVKAGQLGITTFFLARGFKKCITEDNVNAVVVAYEEFLTSRLLKRVRHMYQRLPMSNKNKPKMNHDSTYEMSFPNRRSTFYIGTAGAKVFGRGEPIHYSLNSEVAFWDDPKNILDPIEDRVPLGCEMIVESTPNGEGTNIEPNVFFQMVQDCLEGESIWKLHQLVWWLEPEYRLPIGSEYALERDRPKITDFTDEEITLAILAKWDDFEADERIRWRRRKISTKKSGFWQEFLEDIVNCFLTTKEPFYDWETLERLTKGCYEPEDHFGAAKVWFPPVSEEEHPVYMICVDPGQGKVTRSVALVFRMDLDDFSTIRHEATLSGMFDSEAFAPLCVKLGEYYHNAKMVPEANGHGLAFCAKVTDYVNLYWRTDVVSGISSKQIGWKTTGATRLGASGTKMYAISELQALLPIITTYDTNLVREMRQVKWSGSNIMFLSTDDYHDAAMIMAATRSSGMGNSQSGFMGSSGWNW